MNTHAAPDSPAPGSPRPARRHAGPVAGLAAALLLTGGCRFLAPHYQRPDLPVPDAYPADAAPAHTVDATADAGADDEHRAALGWRELYADPALDRLVEQALLHNRDLRIARLHANEAHTAFDLRRDDRWPVIAAQAAAVRGRLPAGAGLGGQALDPRIVFAGVGVSDWELDFWGRLANLTEAARERYLASDEARRAVAIELVAAVANSYFSLRELQQRLALARHTLASREESLRIFSLRLQVGSTSRFDWTQAETLLTQASSAAAELEQARAAEAHRLTLLIGAAHEDPAGDSAGGPAAPDPACRPDPGLPSDLLARRPDIRAAEHQLKATYADIGVARAAFFPRISLTGVFGTVSPELDGLFAAGGGAWIVNPNAALPLLDAGRRADALTLAKTRRDLAVADYERTVQRAFREVSDALSASHWLREQEAIGRTAVEAQRERVRLARLRYDQGAAAFLQVLDAERDLFAAEQGLVQTHRALQSSCVMLYAALGGGLEDAQEAH